MLDMRSRGIARPSGRESVKERQDYTPKYATIGHCVLDDDKRAERFPDTICQRLDDTIESVVNASLNTNCTTIEEARTTLARIEDVVRAANFTCTWPAEMAGDELEDGGDLLSDTLQGLVRNITVLEAAAEMTALAAKRLAYVGGRLEELQALYRAEEEQKR